MGRVSIFGKLFNLVYSMLLPPTFPSEGLAYFAQYSAMFIQRIAQVSFGLGFFIL